MSEIPSPRESGKLIAGTSKDVKINEDGIWTSASSIFQIIKTTKYGRDNWKEHELHPKTMDKQAIDWIFLVDTLNFSFWSDSDDEYYQVNYGGKMRAGYWSLCATVFRALEEGIPITSPSYYASITMEQLQRVFRSDSNSPMPLLEERLNNLHEVGKILVEKYEGSFANCIPACDQSVKKLLDFITSTFNCYNDVATYQGKTVALYKRAQILIADIWSCFEGQGLGEFHDIDYLTMFADYRVPQSLVYFNILDYSPNLMEKIKSGTLFTPGERHEVEIRGCSIWAVELLLEKLKQLVSQDSSMKDVVLNSIVVDYYLWDYAQSHQKDMNHIPIHKIRTIYY